MTAPGELLPPAEPIGHVPTLTLLDALRAAGWRATGIGVAAATLRHPTVELPIRVTMSLDDTSRLEAVFVGDRQVSFRHAIEHARCAT